MKKYILPIVLFFLLVQTASAYTFLNIYIEENGVTEFFGETNENISLPEGVRITEDKILGKTSSLTSKQGNLWTFSYSLQGAEINLILPKGAVIKSLSEGEISTSQERISVYFKDSIILTYAINDVPTKANSGAILAGIILFALFIISIVYLINYSKRDKHHKKHKPKNKSQNKQKQKSEISNLLNERENLILNKLKETGKIKQSQLRKNTQIPKASLSRHLQELEKKSLIKRSGEGKNKFIEIV